MRTSRIADSRQYREPFDANGEVNNLRKAFPVLLSAAKEGGCLGSGAGGPVLENREKGSTAKQTRPGKAGSRGAPGPFSC